MKFVDWRKFIKLLRRTYFFQALRYSIEKQSLSKRMVLSSLMNYSYSKVNRNYFYSEMCHGNCNRLSNDKANCSLLILLISSFGFKRMQEAIIIPLSKKIWNKVRFRDKYVLRPAHPKSLWFVCQGGLESRYGQTTTSFFISMESLLIDVSLGLNMKCPSCCHLLYALSANGVLFWAVTYMSRPRQGGSLL